MERKLISKSVILWVLFLASFIPYILLVITAVRGADTSIFAVSMVYGFDALKHMASILFIYVPICSLTLIWQIVYAIFFLKKETATKKKITAILVVMFLLAIFIPAICWEVSINKSTRDFKEKYYPQVEDYLNANFSPEFLSKCELKDVSPDNYCFLFSTGEMFFDRENEFRVYVGNTIFSDMVSKLSQSIAFGGTFPEGLGEYVDSENNLPENQDLGLSITDADLTHYNYGDSEESLFEYCDYKAISLILNETEFDSDVVSREIMDFILCHSDLIEDDLSVFSFYIRVNGQNCASVNVFQDHENLDSYELRFRGYSDSNGVKTIEDFEMNISLEG